MSGVLLEVRDLSYAYPDGTRALTGVGFTVAAGEKVALVGPNGSGKSTMLLVLAGLIKGQGGIRFEGRDLEDVPHKELRSRLGLVFQSPDDQLFMPTLADDLAFGPVNLGLNRAEVERRVHASASSLKLEAFLDRPPHHLSFGQRRTAAIATALTMQPAVVLMDEPSSNLDPRARRRLADLLSTLPTALLMASHDLTLVERICTRVVLLDGGRLIADGPTAGILSDKALMEAHGLEG